MLAASAFLASWMSQPELAKAMSFTQSETRTESQLFRNQNTFPPNRFNFDVPELVSNTISYSISWVDLDTDGIDFFFRDEDFDVFFQGQTGAPSRILNNVGFNRGNFSFFNTDGLYTGSLQLPSLDAGTLSFLIRNDRRFGNGINFFPPEGSLTVAITGEAVPTPAALPGLIGLGVAALRNKKKTTAESAQKP